MKQSSSHISSILKVHWCVSCDNGKHCQRMLTCPHRHVVLIAYKVAQRKLGLHAWLHVGQQVRYICGDRVGLVCLKHCRLSSGALHSLQHMQQSRWILLLLLLLLPSSACMKWGPAMRGGTMCNCYCACDC